MIYADIIIDISSDKLDRSFQYRVPERLEKKIKAGMVAAIPFGNAGRVRKGYVIGLSDKPKIAPEKIKEISEICSGEETTESRLIALAAWMRENYGSTMIQALRTVLPIQEKIKAKEKKYICLDISEEAGTQLPRPEPLGTFVTSECITKPLPRRSSISPRVCPSLGIIPQARRQAFCRAKGS